MRKITLLFAFTLFFISKTHAQDVSSYQFLETVETYVPVVGNNSTAIGDDGTENAIPLGFTFIYGGIPYTTFSICTNGFIKLGTGITGVSYTNDLNVTYANRPLIAALWDDNNRTTGSIQYLVNGVSPNRTLEIGWNSINIGGGGVTSATAFGSFKMRLFESTGQIDFVYAPMITTLAMTASIGLLDNTNYLSVTPNNPSTVSSTAANNGINSTANLTGKKYSFIPQPQCSGTPSPGNTVASVNSICTNTIFTLSLQNQLVGFGIAYQWQSSADGISYSNIDGTLSFNSIEVSQIIATYYQCIVSCGGNFMTSTPIQVGLNSINTCYCSPTYTTGMTAGDLISNVVIDNTTLSNNTGIEPVNPEYTYFTGQPNFTAILEAGLSYSLNISVGSYQDQSVAVWIDFNDDSVFSNEEKVGISTTPIESFGTGVINLILGCESLPGLHRMRIRDVWNIDSNAIEPCSNYGYGETEDYDISIITASGCQEPSGLNASGINSSSALLSWNLSCGSVSWDLHLTSQGGGLPSGNPSNPNATSPLLVTNLESFTTFDFYVKSYCEANGESTWAGPFTFTTLPLAVANDDCFIATSLTVGGTFDENAVVTTNIGATTSVGNPNPTCAIFGFGGDVWFSLVVPSDGNVNVETKTETGSALVDTGMTVFSGVCGTLTTLACNDDKGIDSFSLLSLTGLTPGETIYVRVWEYANDTFGQFRVSAWNPTLSINAFENGSFSHYPNPVKGILNVTFSENISKVEVFNLLGQKVMMQNVNATQVQIDMSGLPNGTYLAKVFSDSQFKTVKVLKE